MLIIFFTNFQLKDLLKKTTGGREIEDNIAREDSPDVKKHKILVSISGKGQILPSEGSCY